VSALGALLDRLPRTSLVVGKGGVGKTTCAAGIAAAFAARHERTLLLSTDPAAALASALGTQVGATAAAVPTRSLLDARQLSAADLREDFLNRWRDVIAEIVDRGTYLERADVDGLVDASLPGADEIFSLLAVADLLANAASYKRLVVDTAPTGHTLRLLSLPDTFRALVTMLDRMQEKHRFMVRTLTRRYRRDRADAFLDEMRQRIEGLRGSLADATRLSAIVVTRAEPVVQAETSRYVRGLRTLQIGIAAVIVNAVPSSSDPAWAGAPQRPEVHDIPRFRLPYERAPICDLGDIVALLDTIVDEGSRPQPTASPEGHRRTAQAVSLREAPEHDAPALESLLQALTIVGGKGGVGKSTASSALALAAADIATRTGAKPVLLVSTDPAPSLADAFGEPDAPWARDDIEQTLEITPRLVVRQMDAGAAFARVRDRYRDRIDAVFDSLAGRGLDARQDHAILRDLMALAPPGIDEVYALAILGDALADGRFSRIVVDPAPSGHLLRMLEMPSLALDWTHRLMRLMLKYQEVVGLGDAAQDLLEFARRTRSLDAMLHDAARCVVLIVTLDEPIVRAETERLAGLVRASGIGVGAIIWNRLRADPQPLPTTVAARQVLAPEATPPPIGARALREWSASWRDAWLDR
jgi:arsenite-transporting ATPase